MNMDWVPWVIRAVLIVVGIITVIMVSKRKREGIYQGQYYIGIFVIGITAFTMGVILLIISVNRQGKWDTIGTEDNGHLGACSCSLEEVK